MLFISLHKIVLLLIVNGRNKFANEQSAHGFTTSTCIVKENEIKQHVVPQVN